MEKIISYENINKGLEIYDEHYSKICLSFSNNKSI